MDRTVSRMLESAMTARQLIEEIQHQVTDLDTPVVFVADYGDYHHTKQALALMSVNLIDSGQLYESAYSNSRVAVCGNEEGEEDERDDDVVEVVIFNLDE